MVTLLNRPLAGQEPTPVRSPLIEPKQEIVDMGREQAHLGVTVRDDHHGHVFIRSVLAGSPADRALLRPGDQLVAFNTQSVRSLNDAVHFINSKSPGDEVTVIIRRNGLEGSYMAVLGLPEGVISKNVTLPAHIVQYAVPYPGYTYYPEYVYPDTQQEYRDPVHYGHYGTGYGNPALEYGPPAVPSNEVTPGVGGGGIFGRR